MNKMINLIVLPIIIPLLTAVILIFFSIRKKRLFKAGESDGVSNQKDTILII